MKTVIVLTFVFLAAALGQDIGLRAGQTGQFKEFPYCQCQKYPAAYSLAPLVRKGNTNTYCTTVKVLLPSNCTDYCCLRADAKKLEIDAKTACNAPGVILSATVNGAPTAVAPNFELAPLGFPGATVLKLTQLGLNLTTANNAEICINLGTNRAGRGCTNLEQLCVPPAGAPAGTCSVSLFSSNNDCCPSINYAPPSPPPPPFTPSFRTCDTCVSFTLDPGPSVIFPYNFIQPQCNAYAKYVSDAFTRTASSVNASIYKNFTLESCAGRNVTVCGKFRDANGEKVAPFAQRLAAEFLDLVVPSGKLLPYLKGHTVTVTISSREGTASTTRRRSLLQAGGPQTCPEAQTSIAMVPPNVDFPKCICDFNQGVTPFAAMPFFTSKAGSRAQRTQYCFTIADITPVAGPCANATIFSKAEFWASDALRRSLKGFYVKTSGQNTYSFTSATWGALGEDTVRVSSLNWTLQQASGAEICMELDSTTSLNDFCLGPYEDSCFVNIFDPTKKCCPLYASTSQPYIPLV